MATRSGAYLVYVNTANDYATTTFTFPPDPGTSLIVITALESNVVTTRVVPYYLESLTAAFGAQVSVLDTSVLVAPSTTRIEPAGESPRVDATPATKGANSVSSSIFLTSSTASASTSSSSGSTVAGATSASNTFTATFPTQSTNKSPHRGWNISKGAVAGIVIGVAALIATLTFLLTVFYVRRRLRSGSRVSSVLGVIPRNTSESPNPKSKKDGPETHMAELDGSARFSEMNAHPPKPAEDALIALRASTFSTQVKAFVEKILRAMQKQYPQQC